MNLLTWIEGKSPRQIFLALALMHIVSHLPFMGLPPIGAHAWRQTIGSAAAKNFYEEDARLLYPRSDIRMSDDAPGYNYQEFPGIYWLIGMSYHLTGFNHYNARIIMLAINLLLLWAMFFLLIRFGVSQLLAKMTMIFAACSPLYFYYSINVLPNLPALMMFCFAIIAIKNTIETQAFDSNFVYAGLLLIGAVITKAEHLFYGLPIAYLFLAGFLKNRSKVVLGKALTIGLATLGVWYLLYRHSIALRDQAPPEISEKLTLHASPVPGGWQDYLAVLNVAITNWFAEVVLGFAAIPFFLAGVFYTVKERLWRAPTANFWILFLVSFGLYALAFGGLFRRHDYYFTSILLVTSLSCAYGCARLYPRFRVAANIILLIMPLLGYGRVAGRWLYDHQVPEELLTQLPKIQQLLPEKERVVVVGGRTPNVILYYLERKGVSSYTVDSAKWDYLRGHGFRYILSNERRQALQGVQGELELVGKVGELTVYRQP